MIEHEPQLLAETGLEPGACGDDLDAHSGTNETSLMLVVAPGLVLPLWETLPRAAVSEKVPIKRLLHTVAGLMGRLGGEYLARDLVHLGELLGWTGMEPMPTYIGDPSQASTEAGEQMLEAHVVQAVAMLEEVWSGKPPYSDPLLWRLRFLEMSR
jgi:creatinine amidohydrolase/Fe(II)-dependent formamide hydrolase-like protein